MAGVGEIWTIQEHKIKNGPIIVNPGGSAQITITVVGTLYHVELRLLNGTLMTFDEPLIGLTLSHTWQDVPSNSSYGLRLVFDDAVNPTQIVAGPLGSVIERWLLHPSKQPEDMGTITGTKGP
ncbi:MAG: hypothetical protein ACJ76Y_17690 [Thermoanaerobaculia bacterium]